MFEDKYRNDNEKISADQPLKAYIKNKMARERQKNAEPKHLFRRVAAVILCACICLSAIFVHNQISEQRVLNTLISNDTDIQNQPAVKSVKYGEVYLLAKKQYDSTKTNWFTNTNKYETEVWEEEIIEDTEAPTATEGAIENNPNDKFTEYAKPNSTQHKDAIDLGGSNQKPQSTTSRVSASIQPNSRPATTTSKLESADDVSSSMQASSENATTSDVTSSAVTSDTSTSDTVTSTDTTSNTVTSNDITSDTTTSDTTTSEAVSSEAVSSEDTATSSPSTSTPTTSTPTTSTPQRPTEDEKEDPNDYSGTNNQVNGVDEGDIIKTDGKYIYTLSLKNCTFSIIKASKGKMDVLSTTTVKGADFYSGDGAEMYILGDKVVLVSSFYKKATDGTKTAYVRSRVDVFNCSDKNAPVLEKTFEQDGLVHSSRLIDNKLYLISKQNTLYAKPEENDPKTYVPCTYEGDTANTVEEDNLYIAADYSTYGYVIISSYDIQSATKINSLAVMGNCNTMYMSTSSLYICANKHDASSSYTLLSRFDIKDGNIKLQSLGAVTGTVLNQFSLDEYNGNLRMVVTIDIREEIKKDVQRYTASGSIVNDTVSYYISDTINALYVLNDNLETIGKIEGIAKGERIYSARFMGPTAYFVTFRQTDPLYSADLSDPENPRILGELKIPGFSEYLHPFGSNLLFGFGQDADQNTGATKGLKLSMFNISNPAFVTEQHTLKLNDRYSVAENNHKAFLISANKNLIAFPGQNSFLVYSYSSYSGFTKKAEVNFNSWDQNSRMVYIGNYLYIFTDFSSITSLSLKDFTQIDKVTF